jgi:hypothetical protein
MTVCAVVAADVEGIFMTIATQVWWFTKWTAPYTNTRSYIHRESEIHDRQNEGSWWGGRSEVPIDLPTSAED